MKYLTKSFKSKILDVSSLTKKIIFEKKRGKKIVMCHGTFDLVHPGHIRHLFYAKEKGDILIVSVTGDAYVTKKSSGTYVPEYLRVRNIAALELVDYTFIDQDYKPIDSIKKIKPDLFIKGYEYNIQNNLNDNTLEEKKAIESVGGKIIFSPGDVVFSSTKFQQTLKPDIKFEKFRSLLKKENLTIKKIIKVLKTDFKKTIHVIGDIIIDKYTYCDLVGQSTKTPTFSVRPFKSEQFIGGAGIVAKHLRALGANVLFTTIAGNDHLKIFLKKDLQINKIKSNILMNKSKRTTLKERFWCNDYKTIQVDYVDNAIINNNNQNKIMKIIKRDNYDCLVFSDFRHGIFNKNIIRMFSNIISPKVIKVADSQVSSRWGNITDFENFDILFPNEMEARFSLADQDSGVRSLGTNIIQKSQCKNLVLKLGDKGSMIFRNKGYYPKDFFPLDSFVRNNVDSIGAGDAYLSATTLFYTYTKDIVISSIIGNFAAAIACEQNGNIPITRNQIISFLEKSNL